MQGLLYGLKKLTTTASVRAYAKFSTAKEKAKQRETYSETLSTPIVINLSWTM